jgi:hypothetical protein
VAVAANNVVFRDWLTPEPVHMTLKRQITALIDYTEHNKLLKNNNLDFLHPIGRHDASTR